MGPGFHLTQVADVRIAPATSIIQRQGSSRRIDVSAKKSERALGDVADDIHQECQADRIPLQSTVPEVLGEYKEQRATLRSIYSYMAAAVVLMFLLTQAVLRSWALTALSLLGVPGRCSRRRVPAAAAINDGHFSLGSLLGLAAVLALMVRQGIALVARFQRLQLNESEPFGEQLVCAWRAGTVPEHHRVIGDNARADASVRDHGRCGRKLEIARPLRALRSWAASLP